MPIFSCNLCSKEKSVRPSYLIGRKKKYCSKKCYWEDKIGEKHSIEQIERFKISMKGKFINENNPMWKGDRVGYFALHKWLRRKLGKPSNCEKCKKEGGNPRGYHWANISHAYKRDFSDWMRLCVPCHSRYDLQKLN